MTANRNQRIDPWSGLWRYHGGEVYVVFEYVARYDGIERLHVKRWTAVIMILVALWAASKVYAEHTEDHRYTIWGYVKDADGVPIKDASVTIADRLGARLGVTRSGARGRYSIRLHLHNHDLGQQLAIEAQGISHPIRVRFDRNDTSSSRLHRVDFLGQQALEVLAPERSRTPYVVLAVGVAVLIPAFLYVRSRRKTAERPKTARRRRPKSAKAGARQRSSRKK